MESRLRRDYSEDDREDLPSALAGLICPRYRGKRITNRYPAKSSRKIMKKLLQLTPWMFQYETYAEEIKLHAWVWLSSKASLYKEGYGDFFDPIEKEFDPDFYMHLTRTQPHVLARDLIWGIFNIGELYLAWRDGERGKKYLKLDPDILLATKKAVMRKMGINEDVWGKKCLPFINRAINHLFVTKIRQAYFLGFLENQSCMFIDI